MAYTLNLVFDFGSLAGLTLNAKVYDAVGVQTGATITTGFVEIGNGIYTYLASLPDGHVGSFVAYKSTDVTIKVAISINPQEVEYSPTTAQIADKILGRNIAGGNDGGRMVKDAFRFMRNRWTRTPFLLTVYTENDSDVAWTSVLTVTSGAVPVTESEPA